MRRIMVLTGAVLAVVAALTATALASSIGVQAPPGAHDLPRIVIANPAPSSAAPTSAAEPSSTTTPASSPSASSSPRPSSARTSAAPKTSGGSSSSSGDESKPTSSEHAAGSSSSSDREHEVVEPRLHESDGKNTGVASESREH
jgi:hypothetical protein